LRQHIYHKGKGTMETRILKIDPTKISKDVLNTVVGILKQDGMIVYPTETFYGLGVNAVSSTAIQKVYGLKGREKDKPLSVVISELEMLSALVVEIPDIFERLAQKFWPGPLTMVFKASPNIPPELVGSTGTIGIRLPAVPWIWTLIDRARFPLTATSANLSGEKESADPETVIQNFSGKVELILDAGRTPGSLPSTVLDLTQETPQVLREGVVPGNELRSFWT
jgi:L-threonylcarbamoyladenylate synthase